MRKLLMAFIVALITISTVALTAMGASTVTRSMIAKYAINSIKIAPGSVISTKFANQAVITSAIRSRAVTGAKIANGTVTAANLATAAKKHVVAVQIGDVALDDNSTLERPIFVAPQSGTITAISFTNATSIAGAENLGTLSVERKTATTATVDSFALTTSMTGYIAARDTSPAGGASFSAGDVYSFKYVQGSTGKELDEMLVTIEYTAAD